ncbi:hypothetical protein [Evansella tamaricis]|uniref:Uncharacterized protein n=1 Tax=Evansella tamaricis TaxID=2069301 RepID=A0ABS6JIW4_9BACI|nr:hypothetical protein [Evansella tamaricis]MBU9713586.1 hypothetical protein [Evansella tamaricis]
MKLKMKVLVSLILSFLILYTGAMSLRSLHLNSLSESSQAAAQFLEEEGFNVMYHSGHYGPYFFDSLSIMEDPHLNVWEVQTVNPEPYFGMELHNEFFKVNRHPLSSFFGLGPTSVVVMMSGNDIITAYSIKRGMIYSLYGETREEVHREK